MVSVIPSYLTRHGRCGGAISTRGHREGRRSHVTICGRGLAGCSCNIDDSAVCFVDCCGRCCSVCCLFSLQTRAVGESSTSGSSRYLSGPWGVWSRHMHNAQQVTRMLCTMRPGVLAMILVGSHVCRYLVTNTVASIDTLCIAAAFVSLRKTRKMTKFRLMFCDSFFSSFRIRKKKRATACGRTRKSEDDWRKKTKPWLRTYNKPFARSFSKKEKKKKLFFSAALFSTPVLRLVYF